MTGDSSRSLAEILAAAPFRLDVRTASGEVVHLSEPRNIRPSDEDGAEETVLRTQTFAVELDGVTYQLSLGMDATDQVRFEQDLINKVYFDELTGLPNRSLIERSINALIDTDAQPFALAFIDLDGFKHVNDFYGHNAGDELLARFSERLSSLLRPTDMLGRLSGDEFLLLLTPIGEDCDLAQELNWLTARMREPFIVDGFELITSASIGVSVYPRHGRTYDMLRTNADRAMYDSKATSKGSVRFFDPSIEHAAAERSRLEQRLRLTIRDRRVRCAYQPKIDFRSGKIYGVEVLLRWIDESGLIQGPGEFIGVAAELGLMDEVTYHVLSETIGAIDQINEAFGRDTTISLNVTAGQAGDFDFMQGLVNAIERTGLAERFMLELTEEAFLPCNQFQTHILPLIRSIGARVSIDDFGVGYSSLSALAAITADEVKVDRSFISDVHRRPRSQSILRAIEALGTSLGMSIVVEGVETIEELAYLKASTGIKYAQGFCFSKPVLLTALPESAVQLTDSRLLHPSREMKSGRLFPGGPRSR